LKPCFARWISAGIVTTSKPAALNLYSGEGVAVLAKFSGKALTVLFRDNIVKLFRGRRAWKLPIRKKFWASCSDLRLC